MKDAIKYIGGKFLEMGQKQFDFMVEEGLKPEHTLIDIACGAGRGGIKFIPYLDKGNYYGIEQHLWLIDAGNKIIGYEILEEKRPRIYCHKNFDFSFVDIKADYALAKSLFTHLTKPKIKECLNNLKSVLKQDGKFYASIFIGDSKNNLKEDNDNKKFQYSIKEIEELAEGWEVKNLGNRRCLRQNMLMFTLKQ